jgi:hypothetical protein
MFYNRATKQAFIFPPKTGTISARNYLRAVGWKEKIPIHGTAEYFINEDSNFIDYSFYGFYRDPIKRFESAILYFKQVQAKNKLTIQSLQKLFPNITSETIIDLQYDAFANYELLSMFPTMFLPQVHWLNHPNVTPLKFSNFEIELQNVTKNYKRGIYKSNSSNDIGRSLITQFVMDFARDYYKEDYEYAEKCFGQTQ